MKPTSHLYDVLPKELQRVICRKVFKLVDQDMAQVLSATFKQKAREDNCWLMQLPAEWSMGSVADQDHRELLAVDANISLPKQLFHISTRHPLAFAEGTLQIVPSQKPAKQ